MHVPGEIERDSYGDYPEHEHRATQDLHGLTRSLTDAVVKAAIQRSVGP